MATSLKLVAEQTRALKELFGLTVREIAKRMGIPGHQATVERVMAVKNPNNTTLKTLLRFVDACGFEMDIRFTRRPPMVGDKWRRVDNKKKACLISDVGEKHVGFAVILSTGRPARLEMSRALFLESFEYVASKKERKRR